MVKGGGSALSPEVVDTYEIVWIQAKADWRYRISTYQSKIKDSITIDGSSDPDFILEYQNNVAAESYGVEVSWAPPKMGNIGEIYLIVRDLFDRQDMSASMTPLEYGSGMPGRRLVLGARMAF